MIIEMRTGETHLAPAPRLGPSWARWLDLSRASLSTRERFIESSSGSTTASDVQYQLALRARLKLDARERFGFDFGVFTGDSFGGGWNGTGWGTGAAEGGLFLKQLFSVVRPLRGAEIQVGGLDISHGESTEVTGYDFDGYLMGGRIVLARPENLFFDEISSTFAYLGDVDRPNAHDRFRRLGETNYRHFLLMKKIAHRGRVSADYTAESGVGTFREAIQVPTPGLRFVDVLHFESYQRRGPDPGFGFGLYGEGRLHPKLSAGAGYAQIDRNGLNSDRFPEGKRLYTALLLSLSREVSLSGFLSYALATPGGTPNRIRIEAGVGYNALHRVARRAP